MQTTLYGFCNSFKVGRPIIYYYYPASPITYNWKVWNKQTAFFFNHRQNNTPTLYEVKYSEFYQGKVMPISWFVIPDKHISPI